MVKCAKKHVFARDLLAYMPQIITFWQELIAQGEEDYILESSNYLLSAAEISDKRKFFKMIQENLTTDVGERVMTIAQQLKAEGREEGRVQTQKSIALRF
jgi:recombination-promoting nuclease RpnB